MIILPKTYHTGNSRGHKPTVVEFVGPPGAGKSTFCKILSQQLKDQGFCIYTLEDIKSYINKLGFRKKSLLVCKLIFLRTPTIVHFLLSLAINQIYSLNSVYRYLRLTIFDLAIHQHWKKNTKAIIVLDQWIIQEIWSATIFKLKTYNNVASRMQKHYFNSDLVCFIDIDVKTASERITSRINGASRFDLMEPGQRIKELTKHHSYLHELFEGSGCKQKQYFDGRETPEKNALLFVRELSTTLQSN